MTFFFWASVALLVLLIGSQIEYTIRERRRKRRSEK